MADYPSFADERWVRIMADYGSDGVWHKDGCGDCANELPVGEELLARLRRWQDSYDDPNAKWDVDAFAAEGLSIAKAVKSALPDWTVIYFDEAALARAGLGAARQAFEYEVRLDP